MERVEMTDNNPVQAGDNARLRLRITTKKPKPYRMSGRYGILNPYGDLWTPETFTTVMGAKNYATKYWRDFPGKTKVNPSEFLIVEVAVTVSFRKHLERQP